jgi:hypothetical protein
MWFGTAPVGYERVPVGQKAGRVVHTLRKRPAESAMIAALWRLGESAPSFNEIARALNAQGFVRERRTSAGAPRPWRAVDVRNVIRSPIYKGVKLPVGTRTAAVQGAWAYQSRFGAREAGAVFVPELAYVSAEQWERVYRRFYGVRALAPRQRKAHPHPLAGLVVCPRCGGRLVGNGARLLRCGAMRLHGLGSCEGFAVTEARVEAVLVEEIAALVGQYATPEAAAGLIETDRSGEIADHEGRLALVRDQQRKLIRWGLDGTVPEAAMFEQLGELKAREQELDEALWRLREAHVNREELAALLGRLDGKLAGLIRGWSVERRQEVYRALLERVELDVNAGRTYRLAGVRPVWSCGVVDMKATSLVHYITSWGGGVGA